jgi:UDP-glucuronate decarboxylase
MDILVTGSSGFVGKNLVERLVKEGNTVFGVDKDKPLDEQIAQASFSFFEGDANDYEFLGSVFEKNGGFDWVLHYAAVVGVKKTLEVPLTVLTDTESIRHVCSLSREYKVRKLAFASSSEVYGEPVEVPSREAGPLNPNQPYAVVKLLGEKCLEANYQTHGLPTVSLRFSNVFGPEQRDGINGFVTSTFINNALAGENLVIYGDGNQTRDFIYIDDNVEATLIAMRSHKTNGSTINIANGRPITIRDLAEKVVALTDANIEIEFEDKRDDVLHRFADHSFLKSLGYRQSVSLEEGLRRTIEYQRGLIQSD